MKMTPEMHTQETERRRICVRGCVQGVGFRPTVYRYACQLNLAGLVRNDSEGVIIEIQGPPDRIEEFVSQLQHNPPPQAQIDDLTVAPIKTLDDDAAFEIVESTRSGRLEAGMPPDLATCDDCVRELLDPRDRRYRYPFLNCTNCGPRFTIIKELPYDRHKTSMVDFDMCAACRHEYQSPENRRFDAQPNACPDCGPRLELTTADGEVIAGDPLRQAALLLDGGAVLAVKGLGGYHLSCAATNPAAVQKLRDRKKRPAKALAVMFASVEQIRDFCDISEREEAELLSPRRPIVIVKQRRRNRLSAQISPDTGDVGAFLPYTPVHQLLLNETGPLVMTSANLSEEPIISSRAELSKLLGNVAEYVLDHNRRIVRRCDDSVLKINRGRRLLVRRSRGFVPKPVKLPDDGPAVLACGGDLKNTFCVAVGSNAYLSQHIGDLADLSANRFYQEAIDDLLQLLQANPVAVVHDMHPSYQSTAWARHLSARKKIAVQHHHAHIASCMIENQRTDPVIGVALDGTGYGLDNTVWGGEFMVADLGAFERVGHFKQYPMPGGDAAARNPARMALGILMHEGYEVSDTHTIPGLRDIPQTQRALLAQAVARGINSPWTSSAGRIFDAVAAILGLCAHADYEGQAPMRLQAVADVSGGGAYNYTVTENDAMAVLDFSNTIESIVQDIKDGVAVATIAGMFHRTVADAVVEMCARIRQQQQLQTVALSGGVFQNELLLNLVNDGLEMRDFDVLQHNLVPPNDAGIALGQAAIARASAERYRTHVRAYFG